MAVRGEGRVPEVVLPSIRHVAVARAYVEGLERDRNRLFELEGRFQQATWEAVQLGSHNRALTIVLQQMLDGLHHGDDLYYLIDRARELIRESHKVYEQVFLCPCGHSKYEHDEKGCQYLGCKHICGVEETSEGTNRKS